jgi:hypothetical protein
MVSTCASHIVWLPRTNFSETGIRLMAAVVALEDAIIGYELLDVFGGAGGSNYHERRDDMVLSSYPW